MMPWHQAEWKQLTQSRNNLHHGILINGQTGIGKREFSLAFCQKLICEDGTETSDLACGQCQNCRLFSAGTHPDFHVLTTEFETEHGRLSLLSQYSDRYLDSKEREKKTRYSQIISVDQVRNLIARFNTHAHISKTRVALVLPADLMNANAANALLKLLEEPPADSIFVLTTGIPGHLPATVRSRCINHTLTTPDNEIAMQWLGKTIPGEDRAVALHMANGGPMEAIRLYESGFLEHQHNCILGFAGVAAGRVSPVDLAGQLNKLEFDGLLLWLQRFVIELIKFGVGNIDPYWADKIRIDVASSSVERLYGLYDRIGYYRRVSRQSVNEQLAIEDLVLAYQRSIT